MNDIFKYLIGAIIGLIIGVLINIPSCNKQELKIEYILKTDTIYIPKLEIITNTRIKEIKKIDTCYIFTVDQIRDTVFIKNFPIEYKEYKDCIIEDSTKTNITINYHGAFSDIDSVLLYHHYFNKQETIVKPSKKLGWTWCIGPQIGFGGTSNLSPASFGYGPYIGIGVSVGFGGLIK